MWIETTVELFDEANLRRYRVLVDWEDFEPEDDAYLWDGGRRDRLTQALAQAAVHGAAVSVAVQGGPDWALADVNRPLSYDPGKYAEFILALLEWAEASWPGVIESVEAENEVPTLARNEFLPAPTFGTDQRDPSRYYADALCAAAGAVSDFNTATGREVLTVMHGMWRGAFHHLDELYQLGAGPCFDRINFHYYLRELLGGDTGRPQDPADASTIWHFASSLAYVRHLADEAGDTAKPIRVTEFGYRYGGTPGFVEFADFVADPVEEANKADYAQTVLDVARRSGWVDMVGIYVGSATPVDTMSLIYVEKDFAPGPPEGQTTTPLYNLFSSYGRTYPAWTSESAEGIEPIAGATADVAVMNPGFEAGLVGWEGSLALDTTVAHSGAASARIDSTGEALASTVPYAVETGVLYEMVWWVRIDADVDGCAATPLVLQKESAEGEAAPWNHPNYRGVVNTSLYPGGWRRIRFRYLAGPATAFAAPTLQLVGNCSAWIDDLEVRALPLPTN